MLSLFHKLKYLEMWTFPTISKSNALPTAKYLNICENIIQKNMEKKEFDENAQMMTLEALIASLLIIAAVLFVVSQVPPQTQHGGSFSNLQLNHYGDDLLNVLKKSSSPVADYDNLLQYYIGENNYSELNALMEDSLPDNVGYSVSLVSVDDKELLFSNGYPMGEQVVVSEIVVSRNVSLGGIGKAPAQIRKVDKTFPAGSLIIPMDDTYQNDPDTTDSYVPMLKGMGLVYHIVNGTYSNGKAIPVWQILQDPRNNAYTYFEWSIYSNENPSNVSKGTDSLRKYAGGPYLIDASDITQAIKREILNASKSDVSTSNDDIKIHQVITPFTYYPTIKMTSAPVIAAYPPDGVYGSKLNDTIDKYFLNSGVPHIVIDDTSIRNGILDNVDIITMPHANLSMMPNNVTAIIIDWVSNGGTFHAECESLLTLDTKVESIDGNNHRWHGFIGIENSNLPEKSMIFIGNDSFNDTSFGVGYGPFADHGTVFNPLAQSGEPDGTFNKRGGSVNSFRLVRYGNGSLDYSQINPGVTILGASGLTDTTGPANGGDIVYASAPFDNGFVTYLAGHDQSEDDYNNPTPHRKRLMFHTVFYPGFGKVYDYGVVELQITMWYK